LSFLSALEWSRRRREVVRWRRAWCARAPGFAVRSCPPGHCDQRAGASARNWVGAVAMTPDRDPVGLIAIGEPSPTGRLKCLMYAEGPLVRLFRRLDAGSQCVRRGLRAHEVFPAAETQPRGSSLIGRAVAWSSATRQRMFSCESARSFSVMASTSRATSRSLPCSS